MTAGSVTFGNFYASMLRSDREANVKKALAACPDPEWVAIREKAWKVVETPLASDLVQRLQKFVEDFEPPEEVPAAVPERDIIPMRSRSLSSANTYSSFYDSMCQQFAKADVDQVLADCRLPNWLAKKGVLMKFDNQHMDATLITDLKMHIRRYVEQKPVQSSIPPVIQRPATPPPPQPAASSGAEALLAGQTSPSVFETPRGSPRLPSPRVAAAKSEVEAPFETPQGSPRQVSPRVAAAKLDIDAPLYRETTQTRDDDTAVQAQGDCCWQVAKVAAGVAAVALAVFFALK